MKYGGFVVDKTLACKALLEESSNAVRISLPRRFGKSFNLSVIAQFFNPITLGDCTAGVEPPDFAAAYRRRREMFSGSLLQEMHPDFFDRHFAAIPVIHLNFKDVYGRSPGDFFRSLAQELCDAASFWINAYDDSWRTGQSALTGPVSSHDECSVVERKPRGDPRHLKHKAWRKYESLRRTYFAMDAKFVDDADQWEERSDLACALFDKLSEFVAAQHGGEYIILIDEYDTPLRKALDTDWYHDAADSYARLLLEMLKGNGHLKQGLLVGVHEFDLSSLGPGVNSVEHVSPTTGRYTAEPTRPVGNMYDAGGLGPLVDMFAFTQQDVDALVARTRGEFVDTAGAYSHDEIMTTITAWYGGYDFGFREPRYSPLPVVKFLEKMAHGATVRNAATLHWVSTGNAATFEQLMLRHREEVLKLISPLLDDYASGADGASIRIADQPGKAHCEMPDGEFQRIYLCMSSYSGTRAALDSVHELVTLLLHFGYLTMGPGNAVRIPNRELQQMWTRVEAIALFSGPDPGRRMQNMRDRLIGKLNSNITTALEECAREAARYIANIEARTHPESVYASHLRNYLGHLLTGWRARVVSEQQQQRQQAGQGRPYLAIVLDAPPGHARRHVVIVQMQYAGSGSAVAAAKIEALAMQGLNQIVDEKHAQAYEGTQSRLDVAIVAPRNMVAGVRSRAWVWSGYEQGRPSIETAKRPGETHEAWLRRMAAVDQTEWQDGLGWVTVPLQDPRAGADGQ